MKLIEVLSVMFLSACSGGGGTDFTPTSGSNVCAIAASGAPLPNVPYTITRLDGTILETGIVATDAYLQATYVVEQPYSVHRYASAVMNVHTPTQLHVIGRCCGKS